MGYTDNNRLGAEDDYGWIGVQYNSHVYNWNYMPMGNLTNTNNEVAVLMHHVGLAHKIDYGYQGTSASGVIDTNNALRNHFKYNTYGTVNQSQYANDIFAWYQKIKTDLRQGYPVVYAGYGAGGHIFMIDGFDVDGNEFQINWGWGGYANGMYCLSNLIPSNYNFYNSQGAILGAKPNNLTDVYENDNTWETSSYMSKGGLDGRKNGHSINPANDVDWINFWNPTAQTITIQVLNSSGDTRMWLYDKYGEQVAYDDDGGSGALSKITISLSSGTYYIKIDEYGNNNIISSYDIEIR